MRLVMSVLAILAGVALVPGQIKAQVVATASYERGPRFLLAQDSKVVPVDVGKTPVLARRLNLDLEGATLKDALTEIETQSGLRLAYSDDALPLERRVHLRAETITAAAALTDVLFDAGVDVVFKADGSAALVKRPPAPPTGSITGRVTKPQSGEAIEGAEVFLQGTPWRTLTAADGQYRLADVDTGTYMVTARRIGYTRQSRSVTVVESQETTADFALQPSVTKLEELVTTGTMVPTEVRALPTPVTVITAEEIDLQRPRRVDQVFRQAVPGVLAPDFGPFADRMSVSVRGASSLVGGSGGLKVFLDGIEVAHRDFAAIDPYSIERVEIIRGPEAASIYGSNAIGGVIQVFTKRGDPSLARPVIDAQVALGAVESPYPGSGALRQEYIASIRGATPFATYAAGAGYTHAGDWLPTYTFSSPSANGRLHLQQGQVTIDLSGRYYAQEYMNPGFPNLQPTGFSFFSGPLYQQRRVREETYGLTLGYAPTSSWRHSLTAGVDRFTADENSTRPRLTSPSDTLLWVSAGQFRRISFAYNTTLSASISAGVSAAVTAGFDHNTFHDNSIYTGGASDTSGTIPTDPNQPPTWNRDAITNTGYFAQGQLGIRDALFLTGAIRADENSAVGGEIGTVVSPRGGLSFVQQFSGITVKLRAAYGEAINPPQAYQRSAASTSFSTTLANARLGPERQTGADAGIDLLLGSRTSLSVTYYSQTARNLIQQVLVDGMSSPAIYQFQNVGRIKNTGVEFEGALTYPMVQVRAQYAYTRSRVEDLGPNYSGGLAPGDQVLGIPHHTAGASVTVRPHERTTFGAGMVYVGKQTNIRYFALYSCFAGTGPCQSSARGYQAEYPSFVKVSVTATQQILGFLSAFASVENLTNNTAYEVYDFNPVHGRVTTVGLRLTR